MGALKSNLPRPKLPLGGAAQHEEERATENACSRSITTMVARETDNDISAVVAANYEIN